MEDLIDRQAALDEAYSISIDGELFDVVQVETLLGLPTAQPELEDCTKMKREFLKMAQYIDTVLICDDGQKEALLKFISRIAEFMPWTERD